MVGTATRDPLMPRDLDHDGQATWWALGTIARWNSDGRWTCVTSDVLIDAGNPAWQALIDETEQIDELTSVERAHIVATLKDLERQDRDADDRWWDR